MGKIRKEGYKFYEDICIPCYFTDETCRLKAASFMDLAQEIAFWAAHELGFGYDDLQVHHTAWVLSRMRFIIHEAPKWRDDVVLRTWHKSTDGLFYLRDFELLDSSGKVLVSATSSWLVLNVETRHLVRDSEDLKALYGNEKKDDAIAEPAPKIVIPKEGVEKAGEHTVSYSDVDMLGHTNNARYMVWAMDALGYDTAMGAPVRDVRINFNRETHPGETVELFRSAARDGKTFFVEGRVGGQSAFTVQFVF